MGGIALRKREREVKKVFVKAFIAFLVLLALLVIAGGGYFYWERQNKVENWGVALTMNHEIDADELEMVAARYNEILDREDLLKNTVEEHKLTDYYEISSNEEVIAQLREDSFIKLAGGNRLHVLFKGKRSTRSLREAAVRTLAEDFVNFSRAAGGSQ